MQLRLAAREAVANLSAAVLAKDAALQRSDLMAKEVEHRVMNSLQIVSSLLVLQSRSPVTDARSELTRAVGRVNAVAKVHKHVSVGGKVERADAGDYLSRLCEDLGSILGVAVSCPMYAQKTGLELPTEHIVSLGLIVNELVTNAAKQGASQISVSLKANEAEGHLLTVGDNGNGLPSDFDPSGSQGLGMQVIRSTVSKLRGELSFGANPKGAGTKFSVRFLPKDLK